MNDLVPAEKKPVMIFDVAPEERVAFATKIANALAPIIEKQKLFNQFGARKHVTVEGWTTMGAMLGILPKERNVVENKDGSYEAWVDLVSTSTGLVVGGASALCGMDEASWRQKPKHARRSMAVTRATGKAYRLGFAWIVRMAGYAETPAEEMPDQDKQAQGKPQAKAAAPKPVVQKTTSMPPNVKEPEDFDLY